MRRAVHVQTASESESQDALVARLRRENAQLTAQLSDARQALERLRVAYTKALEELALLKKRLFVGKAERFDTGPEQLAFEALKAKVSELAQQLQDAEDALDGERSDPDAQPAANPGKRREPREPRGGRRNLADSDLPLERAEVRDPELDETAECIGFESSWKVGYRRGGSVRIQVDRAIYKTREPDEATGQPAGFQAAAMPKEIVRRGLLAPSMIAHVLTQKFMQGVPFYRQEQRFVLLRTPLDRGTMSRYAEEIGAALGPIVLAMRDDAMKRAFCLSTDATGVSIQLGSLQERERGPCRKGHFFIVLADREHVFFEYQPKHTSAAVCEMFRGYSGYIQADAHAIYDALFRGDASDEGVDPPTEVGCWSHARRKFWEAAVCKHELGVEGLRRIDTIFAADNALSDYAPARRKQLRAAVVKPLIDAFAQWCREQSVLQSERDRVSTALGYVLRQEQPLRRFLEDGRLKMTNNGAERGLRNVAIGRKNWLFCGSDDHAEATANLFSLITSCKLHGLDPEQYLAEVIHVFPQWPRDRWIELCPRDWARTRSRLIASELEREIGFITIPPPE